MVTSYLTPTLAKLANEQIKAWYEDKSGQPYNGQNEIDTKGMDTLSLSHSLSGIGVSIDLLCSNNIITNHDEQGKEIPLTNFFRGTRNLTINMKRLESISQVQPTSTINSFRP